MKIEQFKKAEPITKEIEIIIDNLKELNSIENNHSIQFNKIAISNNTRSCDAVIISSDFANTIKFLMNKELRKQLDILTKQLDIL